MQVRRVVLALAASALIALGVTACNPSAKVIARGGTGQITVETAPDALVALYDAKGQVVPTLQLDGLGDPTPVNARRTDANGYVVMRYVTPGSGYTVRRIDSTKTKPSDPVGVSRLLHQPSKSFYANQKITSGYGYLKTRDGTLLSYVLRLPGPIDKGPYPTVIEYSGYDPSNPDGSDTAASSRVAGPLGYATIGVNLRGSGCSGGSFQLWEKTQMTDGYDVVEAVAAQPWVKNHKVGLVGLSYPGNAALYTASTQPPSLAAVAVGGTYDDGFRNLLRPSGIVNSGFAKEWVKGREAEAEPSGQAYTRKRIAGGDKICAFNQRMRAQNIDLAPRIDSNPYYPTILGLGDSFALSTIVDRIKVPTLLISAWQDEQVNGHVASMIPKFTGTSKERFILVNGGHAEMFAVPDILGRWSEFLDLYVKKQTPNGSVAKAIAPYIGQQVIGAPNQLTTLPFPADRFKGRTYAQALAAYEAEPEVRVLFENGGGAGVEPGLPLQAYAKDFPTYPIPGTVPQRWFFGPGGTLTPSAPTAADDDATAVDSYVSDPSVRPRTSTTGGGDWAQYPPYQWANAVDGKSLTYLSPALAENTTMIGSGSVDLWLRSSAADTDLQVTLTEVRPDGKETLVQSGWMRTSVRKLDDARSTVLQPLPTVLEADAAPLPSGEFTPVRIEIYPFAHAFRPGSKIRLIVSAPGGDRIAWAFDTLAGTPTNEIARTVGRPSSVAFPVVPGLTIPTGLPACPGLRGQPCRTYTPPAGPVSDGSAPDEVPAADRSSGSMVPG
ncbi:CocE/NonD family hydrolase [Aquihabitans daechungensis]|uniref:CocE/NonD family hydrolase n=1 Tax=Aquihabitans daechungensis TaxID=1052257 RepID=UPI003B9FF3A1